MKQIIQNNKYVCVCLLLAQFILFIGCNKGPDLRTYTYPPPVVQVFSPQSGYPGSPVTIKGKDFGTYAPAVKVFFNEVQADSIVSVTDSQLVVLAPTDGTTGKIRVQVWTHIDSTKEAFTYLPTPTISRIEPVNGRPGDQLIIQGKNFGTDKGRIQVLFKDSVHADIISVDDDQIVLTVPKGGVTGQIILKVGSFKIEGPVFSYPLVGLNYSFDTNGDAEGWIPQQNAVYEVSDGQLRVTFDAAQFSGGSRRADLKLDGSAIIEGGGYPIVAVKMRKPQICNVIFDTNLGEFGGGKNKWTGVVNGNIYYFDLSEASFIRSGVATKISVTEPTTFSTFQFKIADVTSKETGYTVDWIRSFSSVNALKDSVALPTGKLIFEFNNPEDNEGWVPQQGGTWSVKNGAMAVSFAQATGKKRADLAKTIHSSGGTVTINTGTYPIMAIKFNKPAHANITFDTDKGSFGNGSNKYSTDYETDNVYYWDMSSLSLGSSGTHSNEELEFSTFQFKIADIPETDPETGYTIQWIRTFKSKEALADFINNEKIWLHH